MTWVSSLSPAVFLCHLVYENRSVSAHGKVPQRFRDPTLYISGIQPNTWDTYRYDLFLKELHEKN